jgi:glycosyltransferase involved in cell wall biosynthesis
MAKMVYASLIPVPNTKASSVNILKMSAAFSRILEDDFVAIFPLKKLSAIEEIFISYDLAVNKKSFHPFVVKEKFNYFFLILNCVWRILSKNPEIVFTRFYEIALIMLVLGRKVVLEVHSPGYERKTIVQMIIQLVLKHANVLKLVVISQSLADILVAQRGVDRSKIIVAHDGSDLSKEEQAVKDRSNFKIGYVGSLYQGRGINVIQALAAQLPEIHFHLVGALPEKSGVSYKIFEAPNVIWHGHLSHKEACSVRKKMDLLLAPYQLDTMTAGGVNSTSWMSPLKIFEYMESNVPFICSRLPVLEEVLRDDVDCLLVDSDDTNQWLHAIEYLISSPAKSSLLAKNARDRLMNEYTWQARAQNILLRMGIS